MKRQNNSGDIVCTTAVKLAAQNPWEKLTLHKIAKETKIPLSKLQKTYSDTSEIIPDIIKRTDVILEKSLKIKRTDNLHDILFEIIMTRIEILQKDRKGVLSIGNACRNNALLMRIALTAQLSSIRKMLELANQFDQTAFGIIKTIGLMFIYQATLHTWMNDESKDMSKTMATLDAHIRRIKWITDLLQTTT
jgi:ubiquinone biosynthesis protein COQ9